MKYAVVQEHQSSYPVRGLCKLMELHPGGYYAWQQVPQSEHAIENQRLLNDVKQSWLESGSIFGIVKSDRKYANFGEGCGINLIHRLMRQEHLRFRRQGTIANLEHPADAVRCMRPTICKGSLRRLSPIASGSPTSPMSEPKGVDLVATIGRTSSKLTICNTA